jgi:hypothetical protein
LSRAAALVAALVLTAAGCRPSVDVRTQTAPGVQLAGRRTFRLLANPTVRGGPALETNDPMLNNSITNRGLRDAIRDALITRGYVPAGTGRVDLDVAYYAAANQALDISRWDYGYTWRGWPRGYTDVTSYEQGTVIIDLIDPATHELLWRGSGQAQVSTDPNKYARELGREAHAIVNKLPAQ